MKFAEHMQAASLPWKVSFESLDIAECIYYITLLTQEISGIVEALHRETAGLGVRTLMIEPGRFRTNFLSPGNMKATSQSNIPAYTDRVNEKLQGLAQEDMKQPGDPEKLVNVVVDLIKGEGVAEGRDVPLRVPLGVDCYDGVKRKCEETLKILEDWKSVTRSTDFD